MAIVAIYFFIHLPITILNAEYFNYPIEFFDIYKLNLFNSNLSLSFV
jgi:hypothetical protein